MTLENRAPAYGFGRRVAGLLRRFRSNDKGATAIEFAIVLGPFLAFTFGIITIGLHYLATNSLEKGVFDASRQIRTGQAQTANMTAQDFKALVCQLAQPNIDCSKLTILMSGKTSWRELTPPDCVNGTTGTLQTGGAGTDPIKNKVGEDNMKVLVTACYDWSIAKYLPFLLHDFDGNARYSQRLSSGGMLLQSSVAFQTEPYK